MLVAAILLVTIGALGLFDILYFHRYRCRLAHRAESRTEAWIHIARGVVYTLQFALVTNVRFGGTWYVALIALFVADAAIAIADVLCEPRSRASLGGLPGGEYLMHIVLSVLVGAYLHAVFADTTGWWSGPTELAWSPAPLPEPLRVTLWLMTFGCAAMTLVELAELVDDILPVRPLHVSVRLWASRQQVWRVTQDHRFHPEWDHRFSRIVMLGDRIETGTEMIYEKTIAGITIRGRGRYKLHRPYRQSTFEFWSDDPRSLIRRGGGLWLYRDLGNGTVDFRTSYTYSVRWGLLGRWLDRLVFRPLMQRETERSFRRLVRMRFQAGASPVAGRKGRKPARRVIREAAA